MIEDNDGAKNNDNSGSEPNDRGMGVLSWFFNGIFLLWLGYVGFSIFGISQTHVIPYSDFLSDTKQGTIKEIVISQNEISGKFSAGPLKGKDFLTYRVESPLSDRLSAEGLKVTALPPNNLGQAAISWTISILLFLTVLSFLTKRLKGADALPNPFLSMERSRARIIPENKIATTFADVAGVDEAIEELQEVVQFLKEPSRYSRLGGRLPRGILLVGPPGTGKTLLARAVAGEAGVPFFSISGSEFVELFVGVGAARVRDLFAQARSKAPCIIFIDELDALGRSRAASPMVGGHDEKEQTLNQLLVELDGFDTSTGIVLLAATNRPEILDPALLRAGRFDRHVVVDRPDKRGREAILRVHLKGICIGEAVDVSRIAGETPGFTGADLANLVNEAALLAVRRQSDKVEQVDFENAVERIVAGLEKKNRILSLRERKVVAYHEMGHALVGMCLPGADRVEKVSIIPRGVAALGYTMQRPEEERYILSKQELERKLAVMLGGRASEMVIFGSLSTGAADDIAKATELAKSMVTRYGMDKKLGPMTYESAANPFLQGTDVGIDTPIGMSEETARDIECATRSLLETALHKAIEILEANRKWLEDCATKLIADETLSAEQIIKLHPATPGIELVSKL